MVHSHVKDWSFYTILQRIHLQKEEKHEQYYSTEFSTFKFIHLLIAFWKSMQRICENILKILKKDIE